MSANSLRLPPGVEQHLNVIATPARLAEYVTHQPGSPFEEWDSAPHLEYLSNLYVNKLSSRSQQFIAVEASVRHGKTLLTDVWTAVWYLGVFGRVRVLIVSYNDDFAQRWARLARDVYQAWGPTLFGSTVKDDVHSIKEWHTTAGGELHATGVGGTITGLGYDLIVIDDPIKNWQEARSPTIRKTQAEWYDTTLRGRLSPRGTMVLAMARWHEDDLSGYVRSKDSEFADQWTVIHMPAIAEAPKNAGPEWRDFLGRADGEPLWPDQWDLETLHRIRATILEMAWNALYQQRPGSEEGGRFKDAQWRYESELPSQMIAVRAWDLAASEAKGDWTVAVKMGLASNNTVHVVDVIRVRLESAQVRELVRRTAELDGAGVPIQLPQDPSQAGKDQADAYRRLLLGFQVNSRAVSGSKELRADSWAAAQQNGLAYLLRGEWNAEFVVEHRKFPSGRWDDQVDAAADAFNYLTSIGGSSILTAAEVSGGMHPEFSLFGRSM